MIKIDDDVNVKINERNCFVKTTVGRFLELNIITPNVQRRIDVSHVEELVKHEIEYYKEYNDIDFGNLPILTKIKSVDKFYILDGQHRISALKKFNDSFADVSELCIGYLLKIVDDEKDMKRLFRNISRNMPFDEGHLDILEEPDQNVQSVLLIKKETVDEVEKLFQNKFKGILRTTNAPQRPNVSKTKFRALATKLIEEEGGSDNDVDIVFNKILEFNLEMKGRFRDINYRMTANTCNKFVNSNCYISLIDFDTKLKSRIPKYIRDQVWEFYFENKTQGTCIECSGDISVYNYEAGHIQSERNGGEAVLSNLIPMCSPCNKSLGSNDLSDIKVVSFRLNLVKN